MQVRIVDSSDHRHRGEVLDLPQPGQRIELAGGCTFLVREVRPGLVVSDNCIFLVEAVG